MSEKHLSAEDAAALCIEYLPDVSWGGPWTEDTIRNLAQALWNIHEFPLSQASRKYVHDSSQTLLAALAAQNPYTFDYTTRETLIAQVSDKASGTLRNSRGHAYFQLGPNDLSAITTASANEHNNTDTTLVVADLNFGNIGFAPDAKPYLVDPVYMRIDTPASDMNTAGINILRVLKNTGQAELQNLVKELYLQSKHALANSITYGIACTALPYRGQKDDWMDFQQEVLLTGLELWRERYGTS